MTSVKNIIFLAKKGFLHSLGRNKAEIKSQTLGNSFKWSPELNNHQKAPSCLTNSW